MAVETVNPVLMGGGGGDLFGSSNGLIGGLILGSLLRNNGNLFGGGGDSAAAVGAVATQSGVQSVVNQSAMQQELADIKASIPYNESQVQLALSASQTALTDQINRGSEASAVRDANTQGIVASGFANQNLALANSLASITKDVNAVGSAVQASTYAITETVRNDGDKTRALITSQYEATLNRQLSEANAALAELRSNANLATAQRNIEVNTTNNINQAQSQAQQQQQFQALAGLVSNLANDLQYIRATNQAINIGSGTQAANPMNTNTNVRA